MLDSRMIPLLKAPLHFCAQAANRQNITANQITLMGFFIGCFVLPALIFEHYWIALCLILINRFFDGIDGALARIQGITDAGGFLDISLDFIFYSLVPFAFVLANSEQNGLAGAFLIFSFVGSGSSFLAFASMASKRGLSSPVYQQKSLYFIAGLTEGTETILCFVLMCFFPSEFPYIAYIFGGMCWFTALSRIYNGYHMLAKKSD